MEIFSLQRARWVMCCIAGLMGLLICRVAYLQTYGREQTLLQAERQQHQNEILFARRGSIFDRSGLLMAGSVQRQSLFIDPAFILQQYETSGRSLVEMDRDLARLCRWIDREPYELAQLISDRADARFLRIADNLDERTIREIRNLKMPGIGFSPTNERYYPMGSLAARVLGGVGGAGTGLEGLEMKFEQVLAGKNGFKRTMKDAQRRPIAVAQEDYLPPLHGQHLLLTIDSNIQLIVEQELARACREFGAESGEAVVMDPRTGDILAMANYPTFNPQNLVDTLSTPNLRRNNAITLPYEPGSTLKPFFIGHALAGGIVRPETVLPIQGPTHRTSYGRTITDVSAYSELAVWDVLVKSSNIGATMVAGRMGNENLRKALVSFGFGKQTGVELPGEDAGRVNALRQWTKYSPDSLAQGYELLITPLQLARGFCVFANGGKLVQPHIVSGILDQEGRVITKYSDDIRAMPQVLDPNTATQMRRILADVPVRGTAQKARLPRWNIFGKTGTAHLASNGRYDESNYISSFVGGAPAENPRMVVAVVIRKPNKSRAHYGGLVSAPTASRMIDRTLTYMLAPESPDLPPPPPQVASVLYAYDGRLYSRRALDRTDEASARE